MTATRYAFPWTVRTGVNTDIYIEDPLDRRTPELVFEAPETGWDVSDWSADGKSLLIVHFVSVNESYLHVYNLETRNRARDRAGERQGGARGRAIHARWQGRVFHVRSWQ